MEVLPSEPGLPEGPPRMSIWKTGSFLALILAGAALPWVHNPIGISSRRRWLYEPEAWPLRLIWTAVALWLAYKALPHFIVAVLRAAPISIRGPAVVVHGFSDFIIQPDDFAGHEDHRQSVLVRTISGRSARIPTLLFNDHKFWHPKVVALLDEKLGAQDPSKK